MPYLFGLLVLANAALLGYFLLMPNNDKNVERAKASLVAPVGFVEVMVLGVVIMSILFVISFITHGACTSSTKGICTRTSNPPSS